eukprot:scaffold9503_cov42-Phaeocystis_antarctica.AAC.1
MAPVQGRHGSGHTRADGAPVEHCDDLLRERRAREVDPRARGLQHPSHGERAIVAPPGRRAVRRRRPSSHVLEPRLQQLVAHLGGEPTDPERARRRVLRRGVLRRYRWLLHQAGSDALHH